MSRDDQITRETKVSIASKLVASYVEGEGGKSVQPNQLAGLFLDVYKSIDEAFPEPEKRKVGLVP